MSGETPPLSFSSQEKTFRSYTSDQGSTYAQHRRDYHPKLYQRIIEYHTSTGGQLDTVLDVGCGPGIVTRGLSKHFSHAIGIDASDGMLSTARSLGGASATSEPIRFEVDTAERLGSTLVPPIEEGSVDLITAANAAHWFDMPAFWLRAGRVLKPQGTVALWVGGSISVASTVPNYTAVQAAIDRLNDRLGDYMEPGNRLARDLYTDLPLPWTLPTPVLEFDRASFIRKEWGTTDISTEPGNEYYALPQPEVDLDTLESILGTMSPVTRWREANPGMVNTEGDIVRIMRREIERVLHDAGVEVGKETLAGGVTGALVMVKKRV